MALKIFANFFLLGTLLVFAGVPPALARVTATPRKAEKTEKQMPECTKKEHKVLDDMDDQFRNLQRYPSFEGGREGHEKTARFLARLHDPELTGAIMGLYAKCGRAPDYKVPRR